MTPYRLSQFVLFFLIGESCQFYRAALKGAVHTVLFNKGDFLIYFLTYCLSQL